jgi:hypothetical protein
MELNGMRQLQVYDDGVTSSAKTKSRKRTMELS